jgi:putative ABC transport system permease protein
MQSMLFEVTMTDPVTFLLAPFVLLAVSLLAAYFPVRRAARVDPMRALQSE